MIGSVIWPIVLSAGPLLFSFTFDHCGYTYSQAYFIYMRKLSKLNY